MFVCRPFPRADGFRSRLRVDLAVFGRNLGRVYRNLCTPALYEEVIRRCEGWISHAGPLVVRTGQYTGRSADDKFVVREPSSEADVWWGKYNRLIEPAHFEKLLVRLQAYLQGRDVFVQDCYAAADPEYRLKLRAITETSWHNLFARNMFIQEHDPAALENFTPGLRVIHCPQFQAIPEVDHTRSEAFILLNLNAKLVIIGGTSYAGEIKKSVFTTLNDLLPKRGVLGLHCSANQGPKGDTAIFFGLSGTGKTTLSADPERALIGDDEHGWSEHGIVNFEGGCYAKAIRLSAEAEPEIYEMTRRFGTVLENVAIDPEARRVDLDDDSLTENTRAAYHVTQLPKIVEGVGGHPRNIVMLTADAFGVMPPIAKLSPAQAMYHFLSGYTAKLAGTERGVKEPTATFSPLFGAPFMVLHPTVYADLFGRLVARHKVDCWLVNTGWTGGPYGEGKRIEISHSRAVVRAALSGALSRESLEPDPVFGLQVPRSCPGVPPAILSPRTTWRDTAAYDRQARALAGRFAENFAQFAERASAQVRAAGLA